MLFCNLCYIQYITPNTVYLEHICSNSELYCNLCFGSVCVCKVADLEAHGSHGPSDLLKDELTQSLEELEALLKAKDEVCTGFT